MLKTLKFSWFDISRKMVGFIFDKLVLTAVLFIVAVSITPETVFEENSSTKVIILALSMSCLLRGLINASISTEINSKAIDIENQTLSTGQYLLSKVFEIVFFSIIESLISSIIIIYKFEDIINTEGTQLYSLRIDIFLIVCLTIISSSAIGLLISIIFKEKNFVISTIVILLNLLLSGTIFQVSGIMDSISRFTICRYAAAYLGAAFNLNEIPSAIKIEYPFVEQPINEVFLSTTNNMTMSLKALIAIFAVSFAACYPTLNVIMKKRSR